MPGFGGNGVDDQVYSFATWDDGNGEALYVGGVFETAGDAVAPGIARWDGSAWQSLDGPFGRGVDGLVYSMVVWDDGSGEALYAGGDFMTAGGVVARLVARWDGTSWSPLPGLGSGSVRALAVWDDGSGEALYAGGTFVQHDSQTFNRLARWDGASWSPLAAPSAIGVDNSVTALAVWDDGSGSSLFVGGGFVQAGGVTANRIARWDGTEFHALTGSSGTGTAGSVETLAVWDDGGGEQLFVGGIFSQAGGLTVNRIATWDGSEWGALAAPGGSGVNSTVRALTVWDDGGGAALWLGGQFSQAGGVTVNRVARWDGSDFAAASGPTSTGLATTVQALAPWDDGSGEHLYAGGAFFFLGSEPVGRLARWDGTDWSPVGGPGLGVDGMVHAFAVWDDGSGPALYVGGSFLYAGGVFVRNIARWDGSSWSALGGPMPNQIGTDDPVYTLTVWDDGGGEALYAGGAFDLAGGGTVNRVARWDGASWSALGTGPGVDGNVYALAPWDDAPTPSLYVGGQFSQADGGIVANNLAAWDGSSWSAVTTPSPASNGVGGTVRALLPWVDLVGPGLYVGGDFTDAGPVVGANRIARWDGFGWADLPGPSGTGVSGSAASVRSLTVWDDGGGEALYAAGRFSTAGGQSANNVARWDLIGGWSPLVAGVDGVEQVAYATLAHDAGDGEHLWVGGDFPSTNADGHLRRWQGSSWHDPEDPSGQALDGDVLSLATFDDGTGDALWIGGSFGRSGGFSAKGLARWLCDEQPPNDPPVVESPSHEVSTWSTDPTVDVTWSGASDVGGAGLAGYSIGFGAGTAMGASFVPDDIVDVPHVMDPHGATSDPLADGQDRYFVLRTCDTFGNCTSTAELGPFWIDTEPPAAPADLSSTSHTEGVPSADPTIDLTWTAAVDATSGAVSYGVQLDASVSWSCDQKVDAAGTSATSDPLADGTWYAHVCALDAAGLWGPVATAGPYVIDTTAPEIEATGTVAMPDDGSFVSGEALAVPITQVWLRFDEEVEGAQSLGAYQLVAAGADGALSTTACGGLGGDDVLVPLSGAIFEPVEQAGTDTVFLEVAVGTALTHGAYRLLVCGGTGGGAITDAAGNVVAPSQVDLRVLLDSGVLGPNFDQGLAFWQTQAPSPSLWNVGPDSDGLASSYAAVVENVTGADTGPFVVEQCLWADPGTYLFGARRRVDQAVPGAPTYRLEVRRTDQGGACSGVDLGLVAEASGEGATAGWEMLEGIAILPEGTQAVALRFVLEAGAADMFQAGIDAVWMTPALFADGFESGDATGWDGQEVSP